MSSYLTIYGVPKNEGKPIDIVSLVGPTVYIVQFAMKLMWHGLEKVRYIPT